MHYLIFFIDYMFHFAEKEEKSAEKNRKTVNGFFVSIPRGEFHAVKGTPPDLYGAAGQGEANASIAEPGLRSGTDNVSVVPFRESCFEDYFGRTFSLRIKRARSPPSPKPSLP